MGLTIHYTLRSQSTTAEDARVMVERLRERAVQLPFAEVGELIELRGNSACDALNEQQNTPLKWLQIQACQLVRYHIGGDEYWAHVPPQHLIAFIIYPGDGCEPANIGLCRYPGSITSNGKRVRTKLSGWRWHSFCKTQYASNPACGGLKNFLRCHVGIVQLLDLAAELGVLAEVKDEGGFFRKRDVAALVREIADWNKMIAGAVGELKDTLEAMGEDSRAFVSEITKFPDFEHLEARARAADDD